MQHTNGSRPGKSNPNVTSAVGMEKTVGHRRARRTSFFTRTIIWTTGLICLSLLLASLAQAWFNSQLMAQVQAAQQQTQQQQSHHDHLTKLAQHYKDPSVIESEARQQLGYIRPGEHPIVVISSTDPNAPNAPSRANPPAQQGFWQAWWNVFFGG